MTGRTFRIGGGLLAAVLFVALVPASPARAGAAAAPRKGGEAVASSPLAQLRLLATLDTSANPDAALRRIDGVLRRARHARGVRETDLLLAEASRGEALFWLRRLPEALAAFVHFDSRMQAIGAKMTPRWAEVVNNIGSVHSSLGQLDEAARYKMRALALSETIAGPASSEYAAALYGLALVDYRRGKPLAAIPRIRQAIAVGRAAALRSGGNRELPAIAGITLSTIEMQAGDTASAITAARDAAGWADAQLGGEHRFTLAALNQLGAALNEAGLYGRATEILRRTLDIRQRTLPAGHPDIAYSLNALAFALDNGGHPEEARPLYERSAAILENLPAAAQPMSGANIFGQLGALAQRRGALDEAIELDRKALALARRNARAADELEVLWAEQSLAALLVEKGDLDPAQALLDHAVTGYLRQATPANGDRVSAIVWRATVQAERGDPKGALDAIRTAMAPLRAHLLDRLNARSDATRLRKQAIELFLREARVAIAAGDMETAFDALQMAGSGDLQSAFNMPGIVRRTYGAQAAEANDAYLAASAHLRTLRKQRDRAVGLGEAANATALDREIGDAERESAMRLARLSAMVPGHLALNSFEPSTLSAARAGLRKGESLLLYGQDASTLTVLAITRRTVTAQIVPVVPARVRALQQRMRDAIEAGLLTDGKAPFDRAAAHALYTLLFPSRIAAAIRHTRDLRILAPGALAGIPFDALVTAPPEGDDADPAALAATPWLVRRHAVAAMIGAVSRPRGRHSDDHALGFVGIGAPRLGDFRGGDSRSEGAATGELGMLPDLPSATAELEGMASRFGGDALVLTGARATEAAVRAAPLGKARVIAFATHGLAAGTPGDGAGASGEAVEPGLVLTPPIDASARKDGQDDGLLTVSEIAGMRLAADWVILSACDTTAGEAENAPLYSGLARAFLSAGAQSLLLSQWPVRDAVAARLTLDTVRRARGRSAGQTRDRAEALRKAQLGIIGDRRLPGAAHPAIWAPFVLVGG